MPFCIISFASSFTQFINRYQQQGLIRVTNIKSHELLSATSYFDMVGYNYFPLWAYFSLCVCLNVNMHVCVVDIVMIRYLHSNSSQLRPLLHSSLFTLSVVFFWNPRSCCFFFAMLCMLRWNLSDSSSVFSISTPSKHYTSNTGGVHQVTFQSGITAQGRRQRAWRTRIRHGASPFWVIRFTPDTKVNGLHWIFTLSIRLNGAFLSLFTCQIYGFLFLFCMNLGPFGPLGPLQDREG